MKNKFDLNACGVNEVNSKEMKDINGGTMTVMQLAYAAWCATPDGCSSTWTPNGDGSWSGSIDCGGGIGGNGIITPDGNYRAAIPGLY